MKLFMNNKTELITDCCLPLKKPWSLPLFPLSDNTLKYAFVQLGGKVYNLTNQRKKTFAMEIIWEIEFVSLY